MWPNPGAPVTPSVPGFFFPPETEPFGANEAIGKKKVPCALPSLGSTSFSIQRHQTRSQPTGYFKTAPKTQTRRWRKGKEKDGNPPLFRMSTICQRSGMRTFGAQVVAPGRSTSTGINLRPSLTAGDTDKLSWQNADRIDEGWCRPTYMTEAPARQLSGTSPSRTAPMIGNIDRGLVAR